MLAVWLCGWKAHIHELSHYWLWNYVCASAMSYIFSENNLNFTHKMMTSQCILINKGGYSVMCHNGIWKHWVVKLSQIIAQYSIHRSHKLTTSLYHLPCVLSPLSFPIYSRLVNHMCCLYYTDSLLLAYYTIWLKYHLKIMKVFSVDNYQSKLNFLVIKSYRLNSSGQSTV